MEHRGKFSSAEARRLSFGAEHAASRQHHTIDGAGSRQPELSSRDRALTGDVQQENALWVRCSRQQRSFFASIMTEQLTKIAMIMMSLLRV